MTPYFLIGAARSGTKLLRDVLAEHPEVGAVPYDINYLWRIGNEAVVDDVLLPPLDPRAVASVERELAKHTEQVVLEKTVSNCLRIPALAAAFPNCRFIFLVRDGYDVTESSMRQWRAPFDWRYSFQKARQFPWTTAPGYAFKHLRTYLPSRSNDHVSTWGPRYPGIDEDVRTKGLGETCATQWAESVTNACDGFDAANVGPVVVRYEEFVRNPLSSVNAIYQTMGLAPVDAVHAEIQTGQIGNGRRTLGEGELAEIAPQLDEATQALNAWLDRTDQAGPLSQ